MAKKLMNGESPNMVRLFKYLEYITTLLIKEH